MRAPTTQGQGMTMSGITNKNVHGNAADDGVMTVTNGSTIHVDIPEKKSEKLTCKTIKKQPSTANKMRPTNRSHKQLHRYCNHISHKRPGDNTNRNRTQTMPTTAGHTGPHSKGANIPINQPHKATTSKVSSPVNGQNNLSYERPMNF